MSLTDKSELESIKAHIEDHKGVLTHNNMLFNIMEGDLLTFVLADLKQQLSARSFEIVKQRVAPINVLIKIVDKLSQIYTIPPTRLTVNKSSSDQAIVDCWLKRYNWDQKMNLSNENFNTYKNTWIEPIIVDGKVKIKSIPADRFLMYSNKLIDKTEPTHLIKFLGSVPKDDRTVDIISITTADEFTIVDEDLDRQDQMLIALENPEGINKFGTLPGVYMNRSHNLLVPKADSDTAKMTKLIPVLLSDLNYAVMFQAFSIIWGIDVNDENLKMAPNAFWRFKSDNKGVGEKKPQIGMIKPEVDIDQVLNLIGTLLSLWLQSKNIRPGSIGKLSVENFASGISKMVDEMDTFEDRQKQVRFFKPAEEELWNVKIAKHMQPVWAKEGAIDDEECAKQFSSEFELGVNFVDQRPMFNRTEVLDEVDKEISLGILDRKRAAQRVNPTKSEKEIDQMLADVDTDRTVTLEGEDGDNDNGDDE